MKFENQGQKITLKVTMVATESGIHVEFVDGDACIQFLRFNISPSDFTAMLGGLARVEIEALAMGIDKIGKVRETKKLVFKMPKNSFCNKEIAEKLAIKYADKGWIPSLYFGCQSSFFSGDDGVEYAQTYQMRWVEKDEQQKQETPQQAE